MFIFAHRLTGNFLGTSGLVTTSGPDGTALALVDEAAALANASSNFGVATEDLMALRITDLAQAESISASAPDSLAATIVDGELVGVEAVPAAEVWLHIAVTGGDGQTPLGLANAGQTARSAQASFSLRATADPASAVIEVSDSFRMRLRDKVTGRVEWIKSVALTDGQGALTLQFPDGAACGELVLRESDFIPVMGYKVRLVASFEILIYEP